MEEDYSVIYSVEDYKDRLYDGRVSLADYESRYTDDMETVSDTDYKVLHFDDVVFEDFPDTDRLVLVKAGEEEISVDETIGAVENWLEDIGKSDEVDLESELGINKLNHPYMNVSEDEATLELDEIYPLLDGELTVGEGAEIVENYFAKGTPLARPEGVDVKAESVAVYQIEDIYCYEYALRRYYYNVPVV